MLYDGRVNRALFLVACLAACQSSDKPAEKATKPAEPAALAAPAKAPLPAVDATQFDRACKEATDCVVAKAASCDPCACPGEAIASSALAKFDEAAAALDCKPDLEFKCATPCPSRKAACSNGACVIAP